MRRHGSQATPHSPRITLPWRNATCRESPPDLTRATDEAAAALGSPPIRLLEGHAHLAHRSDPAMVADIICDFVGV